MASFWLLFIYTPHFHVRFSSESHLNGWTEQFINAMLSVMGNEYNVCADYKERRVVDPWPIKKIRPVSISFFSPSFDPSFLLLYPNLSLSPRSYFLR